MVGGKEAGDRAHASMGQQGHMKHVPCAAKMKYWMEIQLGGAMAGRTGRTSHDAPLVLAPLQQRAAAQHCSGACNQLRQPHATGQPSGQRTIRRQAGSGSPGSSASTRSSSSPNPSCLRSALRCLQRQRSAAQARGEVRAKHVASGRRLERAHRSARGSGVARRPDK
jgi:hypothetical protein